MTTATLTTSQRDALAKVRAVRDLYARRFYAELAKDLPANATPSEWVSVNALTSVHHVLFSTVRALVKKGFLLQRPTDGFGNEVKLVS